MVPPNSRVVEGVQRLRKILLSNLSTHSSLEALHAAASTLSECLKTPDVSHEDRELIIDAATAAWNASLELEEAHPALLHATLKQAALELQWAALSPHRVTLPLHQEIHLAEHAHATAEALAEAQQWDAADAALTRGMLFFSSISQAATDASISDGQRVECASAAFGLQLCRLQLSTLQGNDIRAGAYAVQLRDFVVQSSLKNSAKFRLDLLRALVEEGHRLLKCNKASLAVHFLHIAHELCGTNTCGPTRSRETSPEVTPSDAKSLALRVLVLLGIAHIESGSSEEGPHRALACVDALRHDSQGASSIAVPYLACLALLQAGRLEEAGTELIKVVTHEDMTPLIASSALKAALLVAGCASSVRAALGASADADTSNQFPGLVVDLVEAVLGTTSTLTSGSNAELSDDAYDILLECINDDSVRERLDESPALKARLQVVCWNHACGLLEAGHAPHVASKLYALSASLLDAEDKEGLYEAHMAQAVCAMDSGDHEAAMHSMNEADAVAPGRKAVALQKFKLCIAMHDVQNGRTAVQSLATSLDPDSNGTELEVACCMAASCPLLAIAALESLLEFYQRRTMNNDGSSNGCLRRHESVVFQNILRLVAEAAGVESSGALEGRGVHAIGSFPEAELRCAEEQENQINELGRWMTIAVGRIREVGPARFFLDDGRQAHLQVRWFAAVAWNGALRASSKKHFCTAAELFKAAGVLYTLHTFADDESLRAGHLSFTLAAAALMEVPGTLPAAVHAELQAAGEAAKTLGARIGQPGPGDIKPYIYRLYLEMTLAVESEDDVLACAAVSALQQLSGVTSDHCLKMAGIIENRNKTNGSAVCSCSEAYKSALSSVMERLTSMPDMDYAATAAVLRRMIGLAASEQDRLALLSEGSALLASAPQGAFPSLEAQWLVTFAWNRGVSQSSLGQTHEAEAYMTTALRMAPFAPTALSSENMERMSQELARVQSMGADTQGI